METTVYDKASWHYPEGCDDLGDATAHMEVILNWLSERGLLTEEGEEQLQLGIDEEASITSRMVTEQGRALMDENYKRFLEEATYGDEPQVTMLNEVDTDRPSERQRAVGCL